MNLIGRRACLLAVLTLCSNAWAAPPRNVQGIVSQVSGGDSLQLTAADQKTIEVRLRDIDAPESCQAWGDEARKALTELALNKVATLQPGGKDARGRTLGVLMIEDLNVSKFLVENGHAWSIRTRWDQGPLVKQEKMARALGRGLHGTAGALQPKEFRRRHGKCEPMAITAAPAAPAASAARR